MNASQTGREMRLLTTPWRAATALLVLISRASVPFLLLLVLLSADPPITPPLLLWLFAILVAVPAVGAWLLARARRVGWQVAGEQLVVARPGWRVEIPVAAIAAVKVWKLPLPAPGFMLRTTAGRRFGIEATDPEPLLEALAAGGVAAAGVAGASTLLVYASARRAGPRRRWYHRLGKFGLFAVPPAALLFNVHQQIAYGGLLGEYYLLGLRSYLTTLAVYAATVVVYLIFFAATWRIVAEAACLLAAALRPVAATRVRRLTERAASVCYYGGVPVLLAIRFLP